MRIRGGLDLQAVALFCYTLQFFCFSGDGWIRDNLIKWANLHCVRTFINISAFGLMAYAGFMYRK